MDMNGYDSAVKRENDSRAASPIPPLVEQHQSHHSIWQQQPFHTYPAPPHSPQQQQFQSPMDMYYNNSFPPPPPPSNSQNGSNPFPPLVIPNYDHLIASVIPTMPVLLNANGLPEKISCHQCKTTRPGATAIACTNERPKLNVPKGCRKRYCETCLRRGYDIKLADLTPTARACWVCPACQGHCGCAACVKKRREALVQANGGVVPVAESTPIVEESKGKSKSGKKKSSKSKVVKKKEEEEDDDSMSDDEPDEASKPKRNITQHATAKVESSANGSRHGTPPTQVRHSISTTGTSSATSTFTASPGGSSFLENNNGNSPSFSFVSPSLVSPPPPLTQRERAARSNSGSINHQPSTNSSTQSSPGLHPRMTSKRASGDGATHRTMRAQLQLAQLAVAKSKANLEEAENATTFVPRPLPVATNFPRTTDADDSDMDCTDRETSDNSSVASKLRMHHLSPSVSYRRVGDYPQSYSPTPGGDFLQRDGSTRSNSPAVFGSVESPRDVGSNSPSPLIAAFNSREYNSSSRPPSPRSRSRSGSGSHPYQRAADTPTAQASVRKRSSKMDDPRGERGGDTPKAARAPVGQTTVASVIGEPNSPSQQFSSLTIATVATVIPAAASPSPTHRSMNSNSSQPTKPSRRMTMTKPHMDRPSMDFQQTPPTPPVTSPATSPTNAGLSLQAQHQQKLLIRAQQQQQQQQLQHQQQQQRPQAFQFPLSGSSPSPSSSCSSSPTNAGSVKSSWAPNHSGVSDDLIQAYVHELTILNNSKQHDRIQQLFLTWTRDTQQRVVDALYRAQNRETVEICIRAINWNDTYQPQQQQQQSIATYSMAAPSPTPSPPLVHPSPPSNNNGYQMSNMNQAPIHPLQIPQSAYHPSQSQQAYQQQHTQMAPMQSTIYPPNPASQQPPYNNYANYHPPQPQSYVKLTSSDSSGHSILSTSGGLSSESSDSSSHNSQVMLHPPSMSSSHHRQQQQQQPTLPLNTSAMDKVLFIRDQMVRLQDELNLAIREQAEQLVAAGKMAPGHIPSIANSHPVVMERTIGLLHEQVAQAKESARLVQMSFGGGYQQQQQQQQPNHVQIYPTTAIPETSPHQSQHYHQQQPTTQTHQTTQISSTHSHMSQTHQMVDSRDVGMVDTIVTNTSIDHTIKTLTSQEFHPPNKSASQQDMDHYGHGSTSAAASEPVHYPFHSPLRSGTGGALRSDTPLRLDFGTPQHHPRRNELDILDVPMPTFHMDDGEEEVILPKPVLNRPNSHSPPGRYMLPTVEDASADYFLK